MTNKSEYKKDEIIIFTSGSYDEYGITEVFKAIKDFNIIDEVNKWAKETSRLKNKRGIYFVEPDDDRPGFLKYMESEGVICKIIYRLEHTGDAGEVDANEIGRDH